MATYTTTAAAQIANVTVDTIRTWCRMGVIKATKQKRQWVIDATSLMRRIALGHEVAAARTSRPKKATAKWTVENLVRIGGNEWKKDTRRGRMHRVYFNNAPDLIGLKVTRYRTGNISSATLGGEHVSNSEAGRLLGAVEKVWWDVAEGEVKVRWSGAPRSMDQEDAERAVEATLRSRLSAL